MERVVNVEWHGQDYLHLKWHMVCSGLATPALDHSGDSDVDGCDYDNYNNVVIINSPLGGTSVLFFCLNIKSLLASVIKSKMKENLLY